MAHHFLIQKYNSAPQKYKDFFKNIFLVGGLRFLQSALGIATTYFVVRALSKEDFGEYHLVLNAIGILTIFSMRGLNNSVMQSVARGMRGSYRKAAPIAFSFSLIATLILFGLSAYYYAEDNQGLFLGFAVAGIIFPFTHGLTQWKGFRTGKEDFKGYVTLSGINATLTYLMIIASVIFIPGSYLLPIAIILFIPAAQNCVQTILNFREIKKEEDVEEGNIRYGLITTFYGSFNIIAKHIDKLLLFYFISPVALATYAAADRIAELLRNLIQDISVVLAPKFAKTKNYNAHLNRILSVFSFGYGVVIITFAFTLLPYLIELIFGDNYLDSIPYAQALLCAVAIGNLATMRFRYIRSQLDSDSYRNVSVLTSIIRIISSVVFIPTLGITGAVLTVFIYRISMSIIVSFVIRKHYKQGAA